MPAHNCTAHIATPPHANGAIAIIQITAPKAVALDAAIALLTKRRIDQGDVVLCDIAGVDKGIIARPSPTIVMLMPHGGALLVRKLVERLNELGFNVFDPHQLDPLEIFPEAQDIYEACALDAISRAPSALAPNIILHNADLWRRAEAGEDIPLVTTGRAAQLDHLLHPPTIAAIGASNIGKSTLMNALARRSVATVADEPATTRDAVGVSLDLVGLTVTWLDTAGLIAQNEGVKSDIDIQSESAARRLAQSADLVISCADATSEFRSTPNPRTIRCATRSDIYPRHDADVSTISVSPSGTADLCKLARETLLPGPIDGDAALWTFHPALVQQA